VNGQRRLRVFVQARMSSRRFPGKVLAPLGGQPLIRHVVRAVDGALPGVDRIVLTSVEPSDDPLAAYLGTLGVPVFRGPRDDVLERFRLCLGRYPADTIVRVCADSPLLDAAVAQAVVAAATPGVDLATTTFPRSFPRGQNVEAIRADALLGLETGALTAEDREHVTRFFYRHAGRFRIVNVGSGDRRRAEETLAVDTVEDLARLEELLADRGPAACRAVPTAERRG
jgi:spore coat polysaccharide biosynthesis protein SpsF